MNLVPCTKKATQLLTIIRLIKLTVELTFDANVFGDFFVSLVFAKHSELIFHQTSRSFRMQPKRISCIRLDLACLWMSVKKE